jgi:hypothetical protein
MDPPIMVKVPRQLMMGSTPIDRKMFGSTGSPLVVAGILGLPASISGAAKTDLKGKKLPTIGRIVKPLITFLRFIKSEIVNMILKLV